MAQSKISINRFIDKYYKEYDFRGIEYRKSHCGEHKIKIALFNKYPEAVHDYKNILSCGITRIYTYAPEMNERLYGVYLAKY